MSEVHSTTLEPEVSAGVSESSDVPDGIKTVSQMLGISTAEVGQMANELGSALSSILDIHGDQPVICDRLGGVEMTLSDAVNAIWPHTAVGAMLLEGISSVMAEIHKMLNSKKPETEEEEDSSEADNDEATEKVLENKTANKAQNNKPVAKTHKEQSDQKSSPNNTAQKISAGKPAASQVEEPAEAKSEAPTALSEKAEAVTTPVEAATELSVGEPADKLQPKLAQEQPMLDELEKTAEVNTASEIKPEIDQTQPEEPEIIGKTIASEPLEITLSLAAELSREEGLERLPDRAEDPGLIYGREKFESDALALFEFDETDEIVGGTLELDVAGMYLGAIEENQNPKQNDLANLTIEEIEQPLEQLAEAIETSNPDVIEAVNQILDKIIEVPQKTETDGGVNTAGEVEAQKKLEELFIELFDRMNIEYTDEQIESLAYLKIHWRLVDELAGLKGKEKLEDEPQGRGTHEIIKKILVAISTIKKALLNAGSIGKSALRLYNISNARYMTSLAPY